MSYQLVTDYQNNAELRDSLNHLTEKNWGIRVLTEQSTDYLPFSMVLNNEVVANVCVGRFDIINDGKLIPANMIQTVLTAEAHRNRGLIRQLFTPVQAHIKQSTGVTFFTANKDKQAFYAKFGYQARPLVDHFELAEPLPPVKRCFKLQAVDWQSKSQQQAFRSIASKRSAVSDQLGFVHRNWLLFWFCEHFKQREIFYAQELNAYLIFRIEDQTLKLMDIVAENIPTVAQCLAYFDVKEINAVEAYFIPDKLHAEFRAVINEEDRFFSDGSLVEPKYGYCLPDTQRG